MPHLRLPALVALVLAGLLLSGCGYVHFGRLQPATPDAALASENASLRAEKIMLQQELALARKEGIALRDALEKRPTATTAAGGIPAGSQSVLAAQLKETTEELINLRANYARLEKERTRQLTPGAGMSSIAAAEQIGDLKAALGASEEKLAAALRTYTKLQKEIVGLRQQVDRERTENIRLTQQVTGLTAQNERAVAALAQLNSELLAQREARNQAEAETRTAQAQLVIARACRTDEPVALADTRSGSAGSTNDLAPATLRLEVAAPAATPTDAMLRTSPERLRAAANIRQYEVAEGDTLESIARKFYGKPERWRAIYAANIDLLRDGRPLKPGMKLEIPAE
jgi:chromosome segregation ATPase/phage tail protein X